MKKIFLTIILALLPAFLSAQYDDPEIEDTLLCSDTLRVPADELETDNDFRFVRNDAFGVGEKLTFTIGWKMIKAGEATMEVSEVLDHEDRPVYRIRTIAKSFPFFDNFFKVRDTAETWVDVEGLFTWFFRKKLNEGNYENEQVQLYDQSRNIVRAQDTAFVVPEYVQDVLSSLYYVRTLDLEVGDTITISNFEKDKCYPLPVIVHRREIIEVPAGKFKCIKVEPLLQSAGIFKHEGTLSVWLTDDRLKMPVLMKSKVVVGSIYAELTDYRIGELYEW
ncbi:MAG TPA: DUF3108 domain-containing protein [candidate division Zixibacteria bacterium]|mgnify:CR=1 FL=1|nr:DUF3108 domain-containing protein [candidate division Zixibacteria bacterium]HEQ99823.1 DUF3108 domain-containing protein [candidate division Zixibacteria bacterium]